jgi:hypothetical protein
MSLGRDVPLSRAVQPPSRGTVVALPCPCGTAAGRVYAGGVWRGACERGRSRWAAVAFGNSA